MTSNLLLNKLMKRITKSSSDSKDTDKSGEDAVSLRKPSKKFLQYVSSSKHVSKTKSKSHRKKTTPREKSTTTVTPSTAEQKPVGALENKEELESKLMSVASQGGIAGEMASSALEEGVEKEREQYGELATQEYQAKRTQSALRRSLSNLASSFSKNVRASREIEKDITQSYEKAAGSIEENIEYIKKHGTGNWYEYNGQRYRGSDLIKILQSEKEQLEQEKEEKLKELTEYRRKNLLSFWRGSASILGGISSIDKYLKEISSLKEKGAFAIKGEGGELTIFSSKKDYEKWKVIEREKEKEKELEQRFGKGDIWAGLELFGRDITASLGSFEGISANLKSAVIPTLEIVNKEKAEKLRGKVTSEFGETFGKLSWKWSHSDIWGKAGMVLESPGGIIGTSLVTGGLAGLGVGAVSRIAPTVGKAAKIGLAGAGILATGVTAYDVGRTAIVEKDIPKALSKGLVYGISFYGAGKLFKSGYKKGFKKVHLWWMNKYKPSFKIAVFKKTPAYIEGFQELSYRYSIGRKIHETIYFKGIPRGKYIVFATKGKGTLIKGIFRPKTTVFEITPEVSIGKDSLFFSVGRRGIAFGKSKLGKPHPAVFFEKGAVRSVVDIKYIQRSAWVSGYYVGKGGMRLPFKMEGVIYEPKGFTFYGKEKPSFLTPIKGKPTGKVPLSSLYKTEQLAKIIPPLPPLETGELPVEFRTPLIPILVSKKISIKPFSALKTEPKAYELKGLSKVSSKGGILLLLSPKTKTKSLQKQKLKSKLIQKQKTKQLYLEKIKLELEKLKRMRIPSVSLKSIKSIEFSRRLTIPISVSLQSVEEISIQKPIEISKSKMKSLSITIPALKLKTIALSKTKKVTMSTVPILSPPIGKPKFGIPSKKISLTVKRRKKRKKTKRRKWEKTLLAFPFAVEESYIKYGKATHPKPTKQLWKMGYRTMFKIPTVELMGKKNRRKKKKKGGRKR